MHDSEDMAEPEHLNALPTAADLEEQRLQALQSYEIFDTPAEAVFERFAEWTARFLNMPMAMISFVGRDRVVFKSSFGFPVADLPRREAFWSAGIESDDGLVIQDAAADPAFRDDAMVTGEPYIRFYAAAPLITQDGFRIGTLGVMDHQPRDFGPNERDTLRGGARTVMRELETRRTVSNLVFQQELNVAIAEAQSFQIALETVLRRAAERLGACFCVVPQQTKDPAFFSFIAGVAIAPQFADLVAGALAQPVLKASVLRGTVDLNDPRISDTGVIRPDMASQFSQAGHEYYARGLRRQISVPLRLGRRHAAVMVGFERHHILKSDIDFLEDIVTKLVPLLFGRLREEELKRRSQQADYVKRAMRTLIGAKRALTKAATEIELVQNICEVAVRQGGYDSAWVGFAEQDPERNIRVVAKWGLHSAFFGAAPITWADTAFGQGASGVAIRENRLVTMHDIARDQRIGAFQELAGPEKIGMFGSCIAVPLRDPNGQAMGVFTLYNPIREKTALADEFSVDREEEELLTELASEIVGGLIIIRQRQERDEALEKQRQSEARFANLLNASPSILFAKEHDGTAWRLVEIMPNFSRILGYSVAEAMDDAWWRKHLHPDDLPIAQKAMSALPRQGHTVIQIRLARKEGGYFWLQSETNFRPAEGDQPARIVGSMSDVTEKHEAQSQIHRLAFYDQLTGLPNRRLFQEKAEERLREARKSNYFSALLFIDLDRFKAINDAQGHFAGDQVLIAVGASLASAVRQNDIVARLGGDEFVVLLSRLGANSIQAAEHARMLANKVAVAIDQDVAIDDISVRVTASIGVYVFSGEDSALEQILRLADTAMYSAKAITKSRAGALDHSYISFFEVAMQERVTRFHTIQDELKAALAEQRFELWLQPQVDSSLNISGAEALLRLRRRDGSLLPPDEFIGVAEETGLIVGIGQWVRAEACRLLGTFSKARLPRLSVNVSAIEFRQPRMVETFLARVEMMGIDPSRLVLEITESLIIDRLDETIFQLQRLSAAGMKISIDDFGTGYSGLGYLQRLPIHEIKIDKRFLREMLTDKRSADLIQTFIMLARNFNFDVVAEGVETQVQAKFLHAHGCRFMQGNLFGRPVPAAEFNLPPPANAEPMLEDRASRLS
jgi:diguanylate cyclase (GGDEF)-like protein/PAS domain S-box-containing protein